MWGDAPARGCTGHRGCRLSLPRFTRFALEVGHLMVGSGQSQDSAHGVSLGSFVEVIQFTHFKHTAQWSLACYLTHLFTELGRSPGEGNGNPLPHSCLENPADRGVWWAPVHGGRRSRTRPSTHETSCRFQVHDPAAPPAEQARTVPRPSPPSVPDSSSPPETEALRPWGGDSPPVSFALAASGPPSVV